MLLSPRHTYFFLIAVLIGALTLAAGCASESEAAPADPGGGSGPGNLTYYTEQLPPYNYMENGTLQGLSVDLLEAITGKMGGNVSKEDIHLVPWSEGYQTALTRNATVLFSTARTPEREQSFKWVGPIYSDRYVLFAPRDRAVTVADPEDLKGHRIGVIANDSAVRQLLDAGVNQSGIVEENNISALIALLENGEIDLWCYPETGGRYFAEQATGNAYTYEVVYTLQEVGICYAFNRDVPDSTVQSFQQALDTVRNQKDEQGVSDYERIIYRNLGVGCAQQTFTDEEVIALVNTTAMGIEKNATDTFRRINAGEAPYRDPEDPGLYAFVYNTNVTMVAHADNIRLVGTNLTGRTDVAGKPFRDEIRDGALENGTGWVEYVYVNPGQANLYYKTTYYRLTTGSDGNSYVVCSGNFKRCEV